MADTALPTSLDIAEQVARVLRSNEETQKLLAEQKTLMTDVAKLEWDRAPVPWQFGAGAALAKLLG